VTVAHPTAAERRAARRRKAARTRAAITKAAQLRRGTGLGVSTPVLRPLPPPLAAGPSGSSSSGLGLPLLLLAFAAAIVMLGLALTPSRAVPWSRASYLLEQHRDELGVLGFFALVATMVFFVLVQVTN
jgi:hypothetical protein